MLLMMNIAETCNIPIPEVERLQGIDAEYSVKFGGARLAVTSVITHDQP